MKALAAYPDKRTIKLTDAPEPKIEGDDQVIARIIEVGICGTDREIAAFEGEGTPPDGEDHLILGHEALAEVVEAGDAVDDYLPGDLLVPMVRRPCSHEYCVPCRSNHQDFCYTGDFVERGIKGAHGYMTEKIVEHAKYLVPVPQSLRRIAVLTEPLSIAAKSLAQVREIQHRLPWEFRHGSCPPKGGVDSMQTAGRCHTALVIGAGPIGLLGALALRNAGFETYVYSRTSIDLKREIAQGAGATYLPAETYTPEQAMREIGRVDLIYEAAGAANLAMKLMEYLAADGIFVFTGIPGKETKSDLDTAAFMQRIVTRNQVILGTVNASRDDYVEAVNNLGEFEKRWPGLTERLITERVAPEDAPPLLRDKGDEIKIAAKFS